MKRKRDGSEWSGCLQVFSPPAAAKEYFEGAGRTSSVTFGDSFPWKGKRAKVVLNHWYAFFRGGWSGEQNKS